MNLEPLDCWLFYKLHMALMHIVNQRLELIEPHGESLGFPPQERLEIRDGLLKHMDLIDAFATENPFGFSEEELRIVHSWNDLVAGDFYVLRYLKKHTIFLRAEEQRSLTASWH